MSAKSVDNRRGNLGPGVVVTIQSPKVVSALGIFALRVARETIRMAAAIRH
jgi:hypothetical protein